MRCVHEISTSLEVQEYVGTHKKKLAESSEQMGKKIVLHVGEDEKFGTS
jgi:hypothetical protein